MLFVYKIFTFFFYPVFIILIYLRKIFNKEDKSRFKEKIFPQYFLNERKKNKKLFWFHAASIGEIQSILPLINKINKNHDNVEFLITTITLTSGNLFEKQFKDHPNIKHRYFPLDVNFLVKKFLNIWKPDLILFVDSEIWPNFLNEIKNKSIPLVLLNGRITKKTFIKWNLISNTAKKIFSTFDLCLSSNKESIKYLESFKAKNIKYLGNLKLSVEYKTNELSLNNKEWFEKKRVWCALSTHKGEDIFCLKTHLELRKKNQNLVTIIIPRHIDRVKEIGSICKKLNLKYKILSTNQDIDKESEIIIINSYGMVSNYLKLCKSVLMGKSLIKKLESQSGQNPIEAAKHGCKIYHGPYVYNFQEIYNLLSEFGITELIKNETELSNKLNLDFNNLGNVNKSNIDTINELGNKILNNAYIELKKISRL